MDIAAFSGCVARFVAERVAPSLPPGAPRALAAVAAGVIRLRPAIVRRVLEAAYPYLAPFGVIAADGTVDAGVANVAIEEYFKSAGKVTLELGGGRLGPFLAKLGIKVPPGLRYELGTEDADAFRGMLAEIEPVEASPIGTFSPEGI